MWNGTGSMCGRGQEEKVRARGLISGRVQGVCFRAFTEEEARRLRVCGWVRNLADGRVEVLIEGPRADVDAMLAWCRQGSPYGRVDDVEVVWEAAGESLAGFRIKY